MKHLYFVRHGLSVMNKQGIFSGRTDTPLALEGIEQAKAAGQLLKDKRVDLIVSSPMLRANETARLIALEIGYDTARIIVNDLFMERAFGVLEGAPYVPNMHIEDHEGVEKAEAIIERARQGYEFLQSLKHHDTILVVSHGAIGRALRHVIDPETTPFHGSGRFENAQVVKLL